jgi:serine protease
VSARLGALTALVTIFALAAPGAAAGATQCSHAGSAYDSGGKAGGGAANDPLFSRQWGLTQIKAPGAWSRGARGGGVKIAIVDSGVDLTHPDLRAKILPGTDLVRKVASTGPGDPGLTGPGCPGAQDENGHGTHVAGIAAAITGNGIGVAGTAPRAKILPVRVLDANGGGESSAVNAGIRWAADHGAKVINLSLGGDVPLVSNVPGSDPETEKAVAYAFGKGAVVVAAAGNESIPLCDYPAAAKDAVCVAATDRNGLPSFYSNFPASPGGTVAVRAPGGTGDLFCESDQDIWSTMWPSSQDECPGGIRGYETLAGTSMATPFVSGVAALLAGRGLSAGQILQCLKTRSSNNGGYDPIEGYGLVNADAAVAGCTSGTTPSFGKHVKVSVERPGRQKLAESGRLKVTVTGDRAATVKLVATVLRGKHSTTGARKTVTLKKAGTRHTTLTLSKQAREDYAKSSKSRVRVSYTAGNEHGVASN